jgi:hypothetical protein
VNHSARRPNLRTRAVDVDGRPHLILVAIKDIPANTELLYDYGDRSKVVSSALFSLFPFAGSNCGQSVAHQIVNKHSFVLFIHCMVMEYVIFDAFILFVCSFDYYFSILYVYFLHLCFTSLMISLCARVCFSFCVYFVNK